MNMKDTTSSNDEDLKEENARIKAQVLLDHMHYICQKLPPPNKYFPALRSRRVLEKEDEELIKNEKTEQAKKQKFIDILLERGSHAFDAFCEILNSVNCLEVELAIVRKLNIALEEGKYSYNKSKESLKKTMEKDVNDNSLSKRLPKPGDPGGPPIIPEPRATTNEWNGPYDESNA